MGIRIRKVLGYGLTDVKTSEEGQLIDDRFWESGYMLDDGDRDKFSFDGFMEKIYEISKLDNPNFDERLEVHLALIAAKTTKPQLNSTNYYQLTHYDSEFGLGNVICFVPPSMVNRWVRNDDDIDYYTDSVLLDKNFIDSTTTNEGQCWCQTLDGPLYPFSSYIEIETGQRVKREDYVHEQTADYRNCEEDIRRELLKPVPNVSKINNKRQLMRVILDRMNCKEHWTEKFTPTIPGDLIQYLLYMDMFKDEKTIWQLKPMIYTYWG